MSTTWENILVVFVILVIIFAATWGIVGYNRHEAKVANDYSTAIEEFSTVGIGMSDAQVMQFFKSKQSCLPALVSVTDNTGKSCVVRQSGYPSKYVITISYSPDMIVTGISFAGNQPPNFVSMKAEASNE